MRSYKQLNQYIDKENVANPYVKKPMMSSVTSVDVSSTGSYIFASYENGQVFMWSTLNGEKIYDFPHNQRVYRVAVSPNGYGFATACWRCYVYGY